MRWFCEVGTHDADDAGLLHFRSVACRAFGTAAGDPRPGPVHLNVPWRDPLGPEPRAGDVTADSPLALDGRADGRPLTDRAPGPGDRRRPALVDALAERVARRAARPDRRRAAGDPAPQRRRSPASRAATGFPILAEPTSQLRLGPHDRSLVIGGLRADRPRCGPTQLEPDLVAAVRRAADLQAAAPVAGATLDAGPADRRSTRLHGWNEPTRIAGAIVRARPAALAEALADGVADAPARAAAGPRRGSRPRPAADGDRCRARPAARARASRASQRALGRSTATATSSTPRRACRSATRRPSCPAATPTCSSSPTAARTASTGSISSGIGAAAASGRPTVIVTGDLGLLHDLGALAAIGEARRAGANRRDRQRWRRHLRLPAAGRARSTEAEFEALLGTPRSVDPARGRRRCSGSRIGGSTRLDELARRARRRHRPDRGGHRSGRQRRAAPSAEHGRARSRRARAQLAASPLGARRSPARVRDHVRCARRPRTTPPPPSPITLRTPGVGGT